MNPKLDGILESVLYAGDLAAAERFYRDALGLELLSSVAGRHLFFRCGRGMLLIFDPSRTELPGGDVPPHGARGPGHLAFAVAGEELGRWRERLLARGIEVEAEVEWPRGSRSLYVRDPAGNSIELATPSIWGI